MGSIVAGLKGFSCSRRFCGIDFGIQGSVADVMQRKHEDVFCPRGHKMKFSAETEHDRLRAKALRLESELDFARSQARNAETTAKRERTRRKNVEKRIANGICPECHRHFANVERHMKGQHPGLCSAADDDANLAKPGEARTSSTTGKEERGDG